MKQTLFPLVVLLAVLAVGSAAAEIIDVPDDYEYIHDAVQAAAAGDTVLVAAGTYHDCTHESEGPGSIPVCVIMQSGVTLRGSGVDATIIDAEHLGRGIFVEDVVDCRIENLQVTDCFADVYGAGILVRQVDSSVAITDVKIVQNYDGGIICINGASPVLTRVEFADNGAKQGGGLAIEENSNPQVYDCLFDGNTCPSGAGIFIRANSRPVISRCVIQNNVIDYQYGNGGGIFVSGSAPTITHCQILNNISLGYGGGVAFIDASAGSMTDCLIEGNDAAGEYSLGGGVAIGSSTPRLENLLIVGNSASGSYAEGGGMDISFTPTPTVRHCTIVGNSVGPNGLAGGISMQYGADPSIENCIIASSASGKGLECIPNSNPTITGCNIWNNAGGDDMCGIDGGCNFSADPLFCGTALHEYNLLPASPCAPGNHPAGAGCGSTVCGAQSVGCGTPADVGDVGDVAARIDPLLGNHPNPFNPRTTVYFELDEASPITLRIFDMRGHTIASFTRGQLAAGRRHEIVWDGLDQAGRAVPSGVYLYSLQTSRGVSATQRMSLIR